MKSIQNQYRDLKEGRMSQANFMRNLRMTVPQYVTNITSFNDAVKILKNKSILTESFEDNSHWLDAFKNILFYKYDINHIGMDYKSIISKYGNDMSPEEAADAYIRDPEAKWEFDVNENVRYSPETEGMLDQMAQEAGSFGDAVAALEDYGVESKQAEYIASQFFPEDEELDNEDAGEIDSLIQKYGAEQAGEDAVMGQYDPMEEDQLNEGKGKELHPNQINPQELRMGIKVELEYTDVLDKAKKIALDNLAENPFYYTALKLAGIESPSAPKVKASKEVKAKKKKEVAELVDKTNQMQKVKMPKTEDKKKLKEARFNIDGEPNPTAKQVMQFVDNNATLKVLSDDIEIQQTKDEAILRYGYWDVLPDEAIEKLKLQFNVEPDSDFDEDTGEIIFYRLTPLRKNYGNKDLGASFEKFKSSLEEIVREVLAEMQSGDQEIDNIDAKNEE
jgi:hypothetical protein